jgi:hypothetical protein
MKCPYNILVGKFGGRREREEEAVIQWMFKNKGTGLSWLRIESSAWRLWISWSWVGAIKDCEFFEQPRRCQLLNKDLPRRGRIVAWPFICPNVQEQWILSTECTAGLSRRAELLAVSWSWASCDKQPSYITIYITSVR